MMGSGRCGCMKDGALNKISRRSLNERCQGAALDDGVGALPLYERRGSEEDVRVLLCVMVSGSCHSYMCPQVIRGNALTSSLGAAPCNHLSPSCSAFFRGSALTSSLRAEPWHLGISFNLAFSRAAP